MKKILLALLCACCLCLTLFVGLPVAGRTAVYADEPTVSAEDTCTVTFRSYPNWETVQIKKGSCVFKPQDPVMTGFEFTGWYEDDACTVRFDFDTQIDGDLTLYPGFKAVESSSNAIEENVDNLFSLLGLEGLTFATQIAILLGVIITVILILKR